MAEILRFFTVNEILIYVLLGLGGLVIFRWLWKTWRDWRNAIYGLEREMALRRMNASIAASVLIVVLLCTQIVIVSLIAPNLPASTILGTPTLNLLLVPTGTVPAELATAINEATRSTLLTNGSTGCIPGQINLETPLPGEEISGSIELIGSVNIPNLGFYKYEFSSQGLETWSTIQAGRNSRQNESLGTWDTSEMTPGDYLLRLVVIDTEGNSLPPCVVPIRVTGR